MKKYLLAGVLAAVMVIFSSCSAGNSTISSISQPDKIASGDEIYPAQNVTAVEESDNVNGMRFTVTLDEFTQKYNDIMQRIGGADYLNKDNWIKTSDSKKDSNGVSIEYYYYNATKLSFTASVESESGKLMNIGCGTTTNLFISQENNNSYSDVVLQKSAVMAAAACGFPTSSLDVLQDIFFHTTLASTDSLWYEGSVFNLSINEDKKNSEKSTMLFRVFPITDDLRKDWDITDYEQFAASSPVQNTTANDKIITEN